MKVLSEYQYPRHRVGIQALHNSGGVVVRNYADSRQMEGQAKRCPRVHCHLGSGQVHLHCGLIYMLDVAGRSFRRSCLVGPWACSSCVASATSRMNQERMKLTLRARQRSPWLSVATVLASVYRLDSLRAFPVLPRGDAAPSQNVSSGHQPCVPPNAGDYDNRWDLDSFWPSTCSVPPCVTFLVESKKS